MALVWLATIAAVYYSRLWSVVAAGPAAWDLPELGQGLLFKGLPFLQDAVVSAVRAVFAASVLALAIVGAGRVADRWLTPGSLNWAERTAVRFASGAGIWSMALLALACASAYRPAVLIVAFGLSGMATIVWTALRLRRGAPIRRVSQLWQSEVDSRLWQLLTVVACGLAFLCALAPEIEYDALWYHLELPRRWLAAGRPVDDITEYVSLYPLTWELLYGAALSLDGPQAAKLLHWLALVASSVVAAAMGRRALGVPAPWLVAAIFVTAPTVFWESTTAYIDLALALHAGIGAGALWMTVRDEDPRWVWLAGVQLGLACAVKHLGLVIAAIALSLFAIALFRRRAWPRLARTLAIVGLLTVAIPSPWYVRSWVASGNPVFPELYSVFGADPADRWSVATERGLLGFKSRFGRERTLAHIVTLPWNATMHGASYGGTLGPLGLMLLPAVLWLALRQPAARWLCAGAVLYVGVWASPLSSFQLRFLVPWWLFAAPLVACAVEALLEAAGSRRVLRRVIFAVIGCVLALNVPPFIPLHERDRAGWQGWLTHVTHRVPIEVVAGGISQESWIRQQVRTYGAWMHLDAAAGSDARVLTFFGGDHFYANRNRLWNEATAARPVTWGARTETPAAVLRRLRQLGITHLLAPPPRHYTHDHAGLPLLGEQTLEQSFDVEYEDYWTVVYRLRTASGSDTRARDQ